MCVCVLRSCISVGGVGECLSNTKVHTLVAVTVGQYSRLERSLLGSQRIWQS